MPAGNSPGDDEVETPGDRHRLVGEAFEEPGKQRHIDRNTHPVPVAWATYRGEDPPMQVIDPVIGTILLGEVLLPGRNDELLNSARGVSREATHLRKFLDELPRNSTIGVSAASGLGDVTGQIPHAPDALCRLEAGHDKPEIPRNGGLQQQQRGRVLLTSRPRHVEFFIRGDNPLSQEKV